MITHNFNTVSLCKYIFWWPDFENIAVDAGILFMVNDLCEDILRSIAHDEETKEFVWRYFEKMVALFQTTKLAPAMYRYAYFLLC
jgi:hypothetical protein